MSPPDGSAAGPPPSLAPSQKKRRPRARELAVKLAIRIHQTLYVLQAFPVRKLACDRETIGFIFFSVRELVRDRGPFVL